MRIPWDTSREYHEWFDTVYIPTTKQRRYCPDFDKFSSLTLEKYLLKGR